MTTREPAPSDDTDAAPDARAAPERLRRPEPKRTAPIRNASRYLRGARSWETDADLGPAPGGAGADAARARAGPAGQAASDAAPCDDPVARGVALGYEVIEEHIRQGREAARGHSNGGGDGAEPVDLAEFLRRALYLYQDAGSLVQDFIEYLAHAPALEAALNLRRPPAEPPPAPGGTAQPAAPQTIGVALTTTQPAEAWTELSPGAGPFTPALDALRQAGGDAPAITDLRFALRSGGNGQMLHIGIPAGQPPGIYSGVILDAASGLPRGTACVRIGG
ncbi:MAG: hypothetical protein PVF12_01755 [Thiohalocapsa sp.]|jgi:hypothetical protein